MLLPPISLRTTTPMPGPWSCPLPPVKAQFYVRRANDAGMVSLQPVRVSVGTVHPEATDLQGAARIRVQAPAPMLVDAAIIRTQPEDYEIVATDTPEFIISVDQRDLTVSYTLVIEYDDNYDFDHPTQLSAVVDPFVGGVFITPTDPVPETTYWRAKLSRGWLEQVPWTDTWTFTVATAIEPTVLSVSWSVDSNSARTIHLWHLDPPGPEVGDTVTAYGQGFPLDPGRISIADIPIDIDSWTLVPAADNPMVINTNTVEPEHFEIVFTAPDLDGGGPFVVEE